MFIPIWDKTDDELLMSLCLLNKQTPDLMIIHVYTNINLEFLKTEFSPKILYLEQD